MATSGWTAAGEVRCFGDFPTLIDRLSDTTTANACRLARDNDNDVALVSHATGEPVAWLAQADADSKKIVACNRGAVIAALGGITSTTQLYSPEHC